MTLNGDELHLNPAESAMFDQTIFDGLLTPYDACCAAFRAVGLTEEQIASRLYRETKVIVHWD